MIAIERREGTRAQSVSSSARRLDAHFDLDLAAIDQAWADFSRAFSDALVCYAVKANPHPSILCRLNALGASFEAASLGEIEQLLALGVHPERVVFGTAVKARSHVSEAARLGIECLAADSAEELRMMATTAPGARVFVRIKGDDADSIFQMSSKFGVPASDAAPLMLLARDLGLVPWGLSFSVGSQARRESAWAVSIRRLALVMTELSARGLRVEVVNLGGGFPAQYGGEPAPLLEAIGASVAAEAGCLPYPVRLMIEPGRRLVAEAVKLVSFVIARIERPDGPWLFLDCGVYNALFEALSCQGSTRYPVRALGRHSDKAASFVLAGPTGDGLDIIARDISLPASVAEGDQLEFANVGAYTTALASTFNGFPIPPMREV